LADITLTLVPWAPGTSVGAYPRRSEQMLPEQPPTGVPPVGTQTVAADATLTYAGLPLGDYWAAAPVNGNGLWQYVSFTLAVDEDSEIYQIKADIKTLASYVDDLGINVCALGATGSADGSSAAVDNTAFALAIAISRDILVPGLPAGQSFWVNSTHALPSDVTIHGFAGRSRIMQTKLYQPTFDTREASNWTIENISFVFQPGARPPRGGYAWSYGDPGAPDAGTELNKLYNQDTGSRYCQLMIFGGSNGTVRGCRFINCHSGIRLRPRDRFGTQPSLFHTIEDCYFEDFHFGIVPMGTHHSWIKGVRGNRTKLTTGDTAPPHLIYLAGTGQAPEGVTAAPKSVTAAAATDLFTTTTNHGYVADSEVVFTNVTGGLPIPQGEVASKYVVLAVGLTPTSFMVSDAKGGPPLDLSTDMTKGTVTGVFDIDGDGLADFPVGSVDLPWLGGGIIDCEDYWNPYNASFKLRNMRGAVVDVTATASTRVLESSYNQDTHFKVKGYDMRPGRSELDESPSTSTTMTMVNVNFCSYCEFELDTMTGAFPSLTNPAVTDFGGEWLHGITMRNSCVDCTISGRSSIKYAVGSASARRHVKIVGCRDVDIEGLEVINLGADRPVMDLFSARRVRLDRPLIRAADRATPFVLCGFDIDCEDNVAVFDEAKIRGTVSGTMLKTDYGLRNRAVMQREDVLSTERLWRGAHVETLPRHLLYSATNVANASGAARGVIAVVKRAQTFTKFRLTTGGTITAVGELRFVVWDDAYRMIAETGDVKAIVTAINTPYDVNLLAGLPLAAGQRVYLGVAFIGTAFHVRGLTATGWETGTFDGGPYLASSAAYAGGAPPNGGNYLGGSRPYFALI
jgi:hypothetical protein